MKFVYSRTVRDPENDSALLRKEHVTLRFEWEGGAYIDVSLASNVRNAILGRANEVINVWNDETDTPKIAQTQQAFEARCNDWVDQYGRGDLLHDVLHNWEV